MSEKSYIMIQRLYVDSNYQRKGLGKKLLSLLEEEFSKGKEIQLEVDTQNKSALEFYKKIGFKVFKKNEEEVFGEIMSNTIMSKKNLKN